MGNDSYMDIVGIGDICVKANTGYTLILKDVRHVPDIRLNLISTHVLDKEGYGNYFRDGKWRLSKGSLGENLLYTLQDTSKVVQGCCQCNLGGFFV